MTAGPTVRATGRVTACHERHSRSQWPQRAASRLRARPVTFLTVGRLTAGPTVRGTERVTACHQRHRIISLGFCILFDAMLQV